MDGRERAFVKTFEGVIVSYRKDPKTQNPRECLIKFSGIETALHGKKGIVRARFRKGVPGQALGSHVEIIG